MELYSRTYPQRSIWATGSMLRRAEAAKLAEIKEIDAAAWSECQGGAGGPAVTAGQIADLLGIDAAELVQEACACGEIVII